MAPLNLDPNKDYLATAGQKPIDIPEWKKSLGAFGEETKALGSGLKALGAQALGAEEARDAALSDYQRTMEGAQSGFQAPTVGKIEDIKFGEEGGLGRFGDYLAYQVPKGIAQLGLTVAGGLGAGAVAKGIATKQVKELAKREIKDMALDRAKKRVMTPTLQREAAQVALKKQAQRQAVGTTVGGVGAGAAMEAGQTYGQFANDPEIGPEAAVGPTLAYAGIAGILEYIPIAQGAKAIGLDRTLLRKVIKKDPELAKKAVDLSKKQRAAKLAAKVGGAAVAGAAVEGLTEGVQNLAQLAAERYAKEDPEWASILPRTPEEWSETWNAAAAGAATGFFARGATAPFAGTKQPEPETEPKTELQPEIPYTLPEQTPAAIDKALAEGFGPQQTKGGWGFTTPDGQRESGLEPTKEAAEAAFKNEWAPTQEFVDEYLKKATQEPVAGAEAPAPAAAQADPEAQPETAQEPAGQVGVEPGVVEPAGQVASEVRVEPAEDGTWRVVDNAGQVVGVGMTEPEAIEVRDQEIEERAERGQVVSTTGSPQPQAAPQEPIAPEGAQPPIVPEGVQPVVPPVGDPDALPVQEDPATSPEVPGEETATQGATQAAPTEQVGGGRKAKARTAVENSLDTIAPKSRMAKSKAVLEASRLGTEGFFPEETAEILTDIDNAYVQGQTSTGMPLEELQENIVITYGQKTLDLLNHVYRGAKTVEKPTQLTTATKAENLQKWLNESTEQTDQVDVAAGLDALDQEDPTPEGWVSKPNSFGDPTWYPDEQSSSFVQKVANPTSPEEAYWAAMPNGDLEYFATQRSAVNALTSSLQDLNARPDEDSWVAVRDPDTLPPGQERPPNAVQEPITAPSKTFTKVGAQAGSNKGGWYEDAEGKQYYIKEPKSIDHGISEQLAQILYAVVGVSTPVITVETSVPGLKGPVLASAKVTKYDASAPLKDGFVTDAWLGNWDVVGDDGKNYITFDGNTVRIDFGGALRYRAQGGLKGSNGTKPFGNLVTELSTLRDPAINSMTAAAFKDVTDADIVKQAEILRKSISPEQILGIVDAPNAAFDGKKIKDAEALAKTLIARRQYILDYAATLQEKGDVNVLQDWMKDWDASNPTKVEDALRATDPHELAWAEIPSNNSRYGVLVIDPATGKVLMREPTNHYDGYNWTFAKGGKNPGEHPLDTAKRETKEEIGADTTIVGLIGKPFYSSSSTGAMFYVGMQKGAAESTGTETQATKWMSYGEARRSIKEGSNKGGVNRDLEILEYLFGKQKVSDVAEYPIKKGAVHAKAFYESGEFAVAFPTTTFKHKKWADLTKLQKLNIAAASRLVKAAGDTGSVSSVEVTHEVNRIKKAFKDWSGILLSKTTRGSIDYGKPESQWQLKTGTPVVIEGYHGTKQQGIVGDALNIRKHAGSGVGGSDTTYDGGAFYIFGKKQQAKSAGSKVYEFYVSFKNPKVINYNGGYSSVKLTNEIAKAKAAGYDGLISQNMSDVGGKGTQYIVWHRNQVKTRELENLGYSPDKTSKIYESWSPEATIQEPLSISDFVVEADKLLGQGWTQRAIDAGILKVNETSPEGKPPGTYNLTSGQIGINLDKFKEGQSVLSVLLHENAHASMDQMLGKQFTKFHADLLKLAKGGSPTANDAMTRAVLGLGRSHKHLIPNQLDDKSLSEAEHKAELDRVRGELQEKFPEHLKEEEMAYYVQLAADSDPTEAGYWNRLKAAIQAWIAQTNFGKAMATIGWRPEMSEQLAVELAKQAAKRTVQRAELVNSLLAERGKVLGNLSAGQRVEVMESAEGTGNALESVESGVPDGWLKDGKPDEAAIADTLNSLPPLRDLKERHTWFTSPVSTMPEDYNVPGVLNKVFHGMVDRFDYVKKKSPELYRAFDEWKNRQGAMQQEIQRTYLDPMTKLVSQYRPGEKDVDPIHSTDVANGKDKPLDQYTTVEIVGHQLAARHVIEDKVTEKLALKAAPEFLKKLKKVLTPHNVGLLNADIKQATGGSTAIKKLSGPQAKKLFESYLATLPNSNKVKQDLGERWVLFNRRAAGYSIAKPGSLEAQVDAIEGFINAHDLYTPEVQGRKSFQRIAELSDQLADHQIKMLQEGGMLTQEAVDRLQGAYKHYVPLRREDFDYDQELAKMFEKPKSGVGKMMVRKGSINKPSAVHVLQNHLAAGFTAASAAARNQMMNKFYDEVNQDRNGWKPWFRFSEKRDNNGALGLIRNGKPLYIVPADGNLRAASIAKVISGQDAQELSGPLRIMRSVNNWVRWSNVSASPAFILANTPRDYLTAVYNLKASEAADYEKEIRSWSSYKNSFKALHKVMVQGVRESNDPQEQEWIALVEDFENAGGKTSFVEALRAMDGDSWKSFEARVGRRQGKLKEVVNFGADKLEWIENLNITLENVMRLSTYKVMRDKVGKGRAAEISRNLTTNFTRRGAHTDAINTWWLFYNATVQGNLQVIQNLFANPNKAGQKRLRKAVGGTILFAFMIDQLGRALSDDEDEDGVADWDARPDWEKERTISSPFAIGGVYPSIPAPWVFNVFWRMGGMLGEVKDGVLKPQDAVLDVVGLTTSAMNPIGGGTAAQTVAPTAFDPLMQIIENKNFVGNPLGPDGYPGAGARPDAYLAWDSTPGAYKDAAKFVNEMTGGSPVESGGVDVRPSSLKVMSDFALGGLGRTMVDLGKLGMSSFTGEAPFDGLEDVPGLKTFLSAPSDGTAISKYHDRVAKVLGADKLQKLYSEGADRNPKKLAEVQQERVAMLRMVSQVKDTERQIKSLRKSLRLAQARDDSRTEKMLRDRIVQLQKRFNQSYTRRIGN